MLMSEDYFLSSMLPRGVAAPTQIYASWFIQVTTYFSFWIYPWNKKIPSVKKSFPGIETHWQPLSLFRSLVIKLQFTEFIPATSVNPLTPEFRTVHAKDSTDPLSSRQGPKGPYNQGLRPYSQWVHPRPWRPSPAHSGDLSPSAGVHSRDTRSARSG